MFYSAFDTLLPEPLRESSKPNGGLLPGNLKAEIEAQNEWVYDTINNGVYKAGFTLNQIDYEAAVTALFASLDQIETILSKSSGPYLFGKHITEADIRLFPTIIRFDVAYHNIFSCNLKMIRYDYPNIQRWLVGLYWDEGTETRGAFRKSTDFNAIRRGYAHVAKRRNIVPLGPLENIAPLGR
jgi:glutathionyl-hydroquinone reductase